MNLQRTQILSGPTGNINGTEIRPLLAGDSAYSQTNWQMKPYPPHSLLNLGPTLQEVRAFLSQSCQQT